MLRRCRFRRYARLTPAASSGDSRCHIRLLLPSFMPPPGHGRRPGWWNTGLLLHWLITILRWDYHHASDLSRCRHHADATPLLHDTDIILLSSIAMPFADIFPDASVSAQRCYDKDCRLCLITRGSADSADAKDITMPLTMILMRADMMLRYRLIFLALIFSLWCHSDDYVFSLIFADYDACAPLCCARARANTIRLLMR